MQSETPLNLDKLDPERSAELSERIWANNLGISYERMNYFAQLLHHGINEDVGTDKNAPKNSALLPYTAFSTQMNVLAELSVARGLPILPQLERVPMQKVREFVRYSLIGDVNVLSHYLTPGANFYIPDPLEGIPTVVVPGQSVIPSPLEPQGLYEKLKAALKVVKGMYFLETAQNPDYIPNLRNLASAITNYNFRWHEDDDLGKFLWSSYLRVVAMTQPNISVL